jgi:choloylglycine hydrolase
MTMGKVIFAALMLSIIPHPGFACSDFMLNNSGDSVVSARTMDFEMPLQAEVVVVPRGESFQSALSEDDKYMKWTSKYGFVGTNVAHLYAFTDGMNEKGLSIGTLWLVATGYPDAKDVPRDKMVQIGDAAHWILGNFSTVGEVKEGLKNVVITGGPIKEMGDIMLPLHFAIHDANKGSIVVEFIGGEM